jgi:hypothetical protein
MAERRCRECGCTDQRACVLVDMGEPVRTCSWVEPDLCSACAPGAEGGYSMGWGWLHPDEQEATAGGSTVEAGP